MERKYITPFINGAREMLSTMVGISCELGDGADDRPFDYISGTVFFRGKTEGQLTMAFPAETARRIVSQMLGMEENEMDQETIRDGVGEMANIVAGNVKAALSDSPYHLSLSLPIIRSGLESFPDGADKVDNRLRTELGDFRLMYWMASFCE
jgi:CheY-specific phosphatase CheX